jgi:hypothetical protein
VIATQLTAGSFYHDTTALSFDMTTKSVMPPRQFIRRKREIVLG